ncbi:unnamed protein product [Amoebophrya sp. A25]|nr:unnamed protein product [Amoebophrya sp. A25]|eukprot:GSA25T00024779001.1
MIVSGTAEKVLVASLVEDCRHAHALPRRCHMEPKGFIIQVILLDLEDFCGRRSCTKCEYLQKPLL